MKRLCQAAWLLLIICRTDATSAQPIARVGEWGTNRVVLPTNQVLSPAGRQVTFPGRPVDLALLGDRRSVVVKNSRDLIVLDAETGAILQTLSVPHGSHGVTGLVVADSGRKIYSSGSRSRIYIAVRREEDGTFHWRGQLEVPHPAVGGEPAPTGLALSTDGKALFVLSGRGNTLLRYDFEEREWKPDPIAVGVAPFCVVPFSETKAYVSNWGGDPPAPADAQAESSRTPVKVDPRTGAASSGSVSVVDLKQGRQIRSIATGLHPCGMLLSAQRKFLYVACANSDTVEVIDTSMDRIVETIAVRPEARLPFGSGPNALALSPDGSRLYVANGTNNAVAVVELGPRACERPSSEAASHTVGFIPTGWYPGAIVVRRWSRRLLPASFITSQEQLVIANIKGHGSRNKLREVGYNSHDHLGSITLVHAPDADELARYSRQVAENNRQARALAGLDPPRANAPPRPVPERHGEPSPIKHVVYIIKENRTYDQVFGDMPQGNGEPRLVMFGREVTPNQHALAEEFVLLDNFYCSGVLSADGHAWATEAYVTDYIERHFGGFTRSYPYDGDDPLAYSPAGFLWDNALAHGRTFRNYGEFVKAEITPSNARWKDLYADHKDGTRKVKVQARPTVATLRGHTCDTFVGFPGIVPDVYRAEEFLKEFKECEARGTLPNLIVMLLPNDHTEGTRPRMPTPRAMVADNDLALGRIVEAISSSKFWPETAIFVTEDDPQAGVDHVDGHRTIGQVISPYTRRGTVDHTFYSQVGMVKTIELILGLPPMNQMDLAAPAMRRCFRDTPDLRPFRARVNAVPLDEMNPGLAELSGPRLYWAQKSMELELDDVDEADEDTLNRILWHATRGYDVPYPKLARADEPDDD